MKLLGDLGGSFVYWCFPVFQAALRERRSSRTRVQIDSSVWMQPGLGGMRIEHNYLITDTGYERLSQHQISLT